MNLTKPHPGKQYVSRYISMPLRNLRLAAPGIAFDPNSIR